MARSGYTLPVFAAAAAKAALIHLLSSRADIQSPQQIPKYEPSVTIDLLPDCAELPIEQVALLGESTALAITLSDPGDNLDLTRGTPLWAKVQLLPIDDQRLGGKRLQLEAGEGLGRTVEGQPAIYAYARRSLEANLLPWLPEGYGIQVQVILPQGKQLAKRTSNEAFGVLEGLSLLGTSGISQPLTATETLDSFRDRLQQVAHTHSSITFCLGSNGMRVAEQLGIPSEQTVQTANWLGAMIVEAALLGVESLLLIGYHGKLIKLAGGIFNTSSHLADAKLEILSSAAIRLGAEAEIARQVLNASTAEEAREYLVDRGWSGRVFAWLAAEISRKAITYAKKYGDRAPAIGTILFDRQGNLVSQDEMARLALDEMIRRQ